MKSIERGDNMKTKIVHITTCNQCPYFDFRTFWCTEMDQKIRYKDSAKGFPDWCPLGDEPDEA